MSIFSSIRRAFSSGRVAARPALSTPIHARYDAAQTTIDMGNHWANADALDADAANSLAVRQKLRNRSRYEIANNPYAKGMVSTHTNYVIGTGPKLRVQTGTTGMNSMVEAAWNRWCKATGFAAKLRTMYTAKTGDGEGLAKLVSNPAISDVVQLDVVPFECDRLTSPVMFAPSENYIDGITFDEFGQPESYDVLRRHPGAAWAGLAMPQEYDRVKAADVLHWFRRDRPGQHRGIPEIASSLNLFGQARRYREAVIAAAETAADFAAVLQMGPTSDGNDEAIPFTTMPIEKRMLTATPAGATLAQMRSEQPATTYDMFNRNIICEEARSLNMPYNIAACDSSNYSFSGGRLDHLTYYVSVDVERSEAELFILDRVFDVWFREATLANQWTFDASPAPKHSWDWPAMPQIDQEKTASARKTALGCGATRLGSIYAEDGLDYEDELTAMAFEYGVTVEEMKARLFAVNLQQNSQPAGTKDTPSDSSGGSPTAKANGFSTRFSV